jgi:phosphatidylethanolamine-binding protein (PEBP) family uncharacterized protein
MKVLYNNLKIKNGIFLTPKETHTKPKIQYKSSANTFYSLIMHDPDAVGGNLIHWLIVNISGNNVNNGDEILEYKGPAPPKGSGTHKYIILFLKQNDRINTKIDKRQMSMDELYEKLDVKLQPFSRTYFTSKNQYEGKKNKQNKTRKIRQNKKKTCKTKKNVI